MNARDLITVVGCAARVLRDSERTEDIIVAEELIAQSRLRQMARDNIFSHTEEGRAMYRDRPMLVDTNLDELRELDAETLGGAFVRFSIATNSTMRLREFQRHTLTVRMNSTCSPDCGRVTICGTR